MKARSQCVTLAACVSLLLVTGCSNVAILNPDFLNELGFGATVATLPGNAPQLLVTAENRTDRTVEMVISYRDVDKTVQSFTAVLLPGEKTAQAIECPVTEMTLGDVSNLSQPGAAVRLGNGSASDPVIVVEPFGVLLRNQANYNCGDGVTFTVQVSGATKSGYQTFAYIQRSQTP